MSNVLDDINKKRKGQPATTAAAPKSNADEYVQKNNVWYRRLNFDEIPNNHKEARAAGYVLYKKPNGVITWANQTENIADLGALINGEWYEKVDNSIAKAAGRTFNVPVSTATSATAPATTTGANAAAQSNEVNTPVTAAQPAATPTAATPVNTTPKKEKTLLKDIEGRPMVFGRSDALKYTPYVGTEKEVLAAAIERGDLTYTDPNNTKYPEQSTNRQNEAGWDDKMAEKRKAYEDDLYNTYKRGISKAPGNVIYGAKVAENTEELPKSVAYLDGTMPKKSAQTPVTTANAQPTAKVETPAANNAAPVASEAKAVETATPVAEGAVKAEKTEATAPAPVATTTEKPKETVKDEVKPVETAAKVETPAETAAVPAADEKKPETYTELLNRLNPGMTPEEKAAQQKRQRNRQIINAIGDGISALANLYYTNKSGVNAYDPSTSLTKAAKERYDKILAQQMADEENRKAMAYKAGAADIEAAYQRAKDAKADALAAVEAGYKERAEQRAIAESNAKIKTEEAHQRHYDAYANYYNNGGKGTGNGKSSTTNKPYLIGDDGKPVYYDNVQAAFAMLPEAYQYRAKTLEEKKQAIENYNAARRNKQPAKTSSNKNGGAKKTNPMGGKKQNPMT